MMGPTVRTVFLITVTALMVVLVGQHYTAAAPLYGYEDDNINLMKNSGFETNIDSNTDWELLNGDIEYMTDAHTGVRSVKVMNRSHRFGGLSQKIYNVTGNTMYYMSAFFKIIQDANPPQMYYQMRLWMAYQEINGGTYYQFHVARFRNLRAGPGWHQLGGDFKVPDLELEYIKFFVEIREQYVSYMMDSASLIVIDKDPLWREKANADIVTHRTNSMTISADIPTEVPYCEVEVKVDQTSRAFGFGTAVQSDRLNEQTTFGDNYRQWVSNNFNWAVFGNTMKWKPMEPQQGQPKLERVDTAIEFLSSNGIKVRGHSLGWGIQANNPSWVQVLNGTDLADEIMIRVDYMTTHYKGKIVEWDVYNEWLHSVFYDEATGDYLIQDKMYNRSRENDPDAMYMSNDYQALRTGDYTSATVKQAVDSANRGVPYDGMGYQSHLKVPVEAEILRKRLEIGTALGLPVVVSEMSVHNTNVTERARQLDEAMRIYFSNPGVHAIVFWFNSDQDRISYEIAEACLFEGEDFVPNEAGQQLLDNLAEWQTHRTLVPNSHQLSETFDAFHGNYSVQVWFRGNLIKNLTNQIQPGVSADMIIPLAIEDFPPIDPATNNCDGQGAPEPTTTRKPSKGKGGGKKNRK